MLKKVSSEHRFTAYQYPGDLKSAGVLMGLRPGYVNRVYLKDLHEFSKDLEVITLTGVKKLEPIGWLIVYDGMVDCMSNKEFLSVHFDLFF